MKQEEFIEIAKKVERYIQKSKSYQACIGLGQFASRFDRLYEKFAIRKVNSTFTEKQKQVLIELIKIDCKNKIKEYSEKDWILGYVKDCDKLTKKIENLT